MGGNQSAEGIITVKEDQLIRILECFVSVYISASVSSVWNDERET